MGESPGPLEKHRNFTDHNRKSFDFGKLFRLQPENFGFLLCFSAGKEDGAVFAGGRLALFADGYLAPHSRLCSRSRKKRAFRRGLFMASAIMYALDSW